MLVNSIPIQQIKANTLKHYDIENKFEDCIFFENASEIYEKMRNITLEKSYNNIFLEDQIKNILILDKISEVD